MNIHYKRSYFLLLLLLLVAGSSRMVQAQTYQEGLALLDREQAGKAQQLFRTLAAKAPEQPAAYFYQGIALMELSKPDSAGLLFQKAVAADPKSGLAQAGLGYWYQQSGKGAEAASVYEKALQLSKSKDAEVLRWLAEAKLRQEKPALEEIHALLDKALKLEQQPVLYILKGDAHLVKGEGGPAVSNYEKALALDKNNAKALTHIGRLYAKAKNLPLAVQYLQQAVAADPAYAPAHKELGEAHFQLRQAKEAAASYEQYLALTENKHTARMRGGYFMYLAKEWTKASQLFNEVLAQEPNNAIILKYQAYSLLEAEQLQQSEEVFTRYFGLVAAAEQDAMDHEKFARLLVKQGKPAEAIQQYKLALQKEPAQAEALQALGDLHFKQKEYNFSAEAYEQLLSLRKQPLAQDYFALGRAYYFDARYQQADSTFGKLLELQPELMAASLWKARAQSNLDPDSEKGLAKPYYEKVVEKAVADAAKYKNELKEAYSYLAYYYYVKSELATSKDYWARVKAIDPQDAKATNALKALNP
ncbi:tetratricopeptide repeat protein [Cesiribacter sp. SM1]|uniref:tetratricopeptide repeat protein n=1 Tax=Cesiribacter sp. SM1 TaxID=2861196 RepID=UPI001CD3389D|nr:tetratricopeptide repeat protein [Cesiribacter sp. SM1]